MEEKKLRIEELVRTLNEASDAYYGGRDVMMTNYEWDEGFDELTALEEETGYILPNSPTQTVSDAQDNGGEKEAHEYPALSLAKTKKIEDLQKWAGDLPIWLSWKLDGLTVVLTYDEGKLVRILTRGNGTVGSNISYMKDAIRGFPKSIDYKGHLVVRGEATISYPDFEAINASCEDDDERYANPRNLASGTLSLDAKHLDKVKERKLTFNAFTLVHIDDNIVSWGQRMDFLKKIGFTTVDYEKTDAAHLGEVVDRWTKRVESGEMLIPVDGLVITYDDTDYAATGSVTGHHATRAGFAFKWQDESAESVLDHIEWSCAASSITPVAVFDPVQLEGTTVSRASLCNISELERLGLGENRKTVLKIIKSNKIIPKCVAVIKKEGCFTIPDKCPVCGADTLILTSESGTRTLKCTNPDCTAKNLMKFSRFVSKIGLDIDGLSIETLRDFINAGFIRDYTDIFSLSVHSDEIKAMDGYGELSCANLNSAIEKSRNANPVNLLTALCIPMVGTINAKRIISAIGWQGFLSRINSMTGFEDIDGIGKERSDSILAFFSSDKNMDIFNRLLNILNVENILPEQEKSGSCTGLTFVITGDVHTFKNRDEFKNFVESNGGRVASSVSKKTDYLVNNDISSSSSKNRKATELGIEIISEDEFLQRFGLDSENAEVSDTSENYDTELPKLSVTSSVVSSVDDDGENSDKGNSYSQISFFD